MYKGVVLMLSSDSFVVVRNLRGDIPTHIPLPEVVHLLKLLASYKWKKCNIQFLNFSSGYIANITGLVPDGLM